MNHISTRINTITLRLSCGHAKAEPNSVVTVHTPRTKLTNRYILQASSDVAPLVSFGVFPSDACTIVNLAMSTDSPHKAEWTRVNLHQSATNTEPLTTNFVAHWSFKPKRKQRYETIMNTLHASLWNESETKTLYNFVLTHSVVDIIIFVHSPNSTFTGRHMPQTTIDIPPAFSIPLKLPYLILFVCSPNSTRVSSVNLW